MLLDCEHREEIVAAASSCPVPACSSLVIEYRVDGSIRPGYLEDWAFTCSRCGTEFTVATDELIFQSVPMQWLSAPPGVPSQSIERAKRDCSSDLGTQPEEQNEGFPRHRNFNPH